MSQDPSRRTFLVTATALGAATSLPTLAYAGEDIMTSKKKSLFKAVYLVKRKPGMGWDDYVQAQFEHTKLAHALPGLRHYVLDLYPGDGAAAQPFDTAACVFFDDRAAHDAALGSPEGQAALADLPRYLDTDATVVLFGHEEMDLPFADG